MPPVQWSDDANAELDAIIDYVMLHDLTAAVRLATRIRNAAANLSEFPRRFRQLGSGLHQISTVHPYLIRYEVTDDLVTIVSVRHGPRGDG